MTLDEANLLWLRGRAASRKRRSLSDALDEILTEARKGGRGGEAPRSVVGTVDLSLDDPNLEGADAYVQTMIEASLKRPVVVRERPDTERLPNLRKPAARKSRRG